MVNTEGTTGTTRAHGQKCSSCGLMRDCGGCTTDVVLICVCHAFEHEFVAQGFLLCYNCYGPFYPSFAAFRASPCLEGLWFLRMINTYCFFVSIVELFPVVTTQRIHVTSPLWMWVWDTPKLLQALLIVCFSEVMVLSSLAATMKVIGSTLGQGRNLQPSCRRLFTHRFLRSDGRAACGSNCWLFAGANHRVLLQSNGVAVARWNKVKECNIPPLAPGLRYTQISAGSWHTVLLRPDGTAIAFGLNEAGQCNLPPLDEGMSYTSYTWVFAGRYRTVLLTFLTKMMMTSLWDALVWTELKCCNWEPDLRTSKEPREILPDGELLDVVCRANPNATLMTVSLKHGKAGGAWYTHVRRRPRWPEKLDAHRGRCCKGSFHVEYLRLSS